MNLDRDFMSEHELCQVLTRSAQQYREHFELDDDATVKIWVPVEKFAGLASQEGLTPAQLLARVEGYDHRYRIENRAALVG